MVQPTTAVATLSSTTTTSSQQSERINATIHSELTPNYINTTKSSNRNRVLLLPLVSRHRIATVVQLLTMILFLKNSVPKAACFGFGVGRPSSQFLLKQKSYFTRTANRHSAAATYRPFSGKMTKPHITHISNIYNKRRRIHHLLLSSSSNDVASEQQKRRQQRQQQQQERFKSHINNWPCLYQSSNNSEFITHFVAVAADDTVHNRNNETDTSVYDTDAYNHYSNNNNITVEEAILSVLPREVLPNRHSSSSSSISVLEVRKNLLEREKDVVVQAVEPQMRHDPKQFPLDAQLSPAELVALGSIWFLSGSTPRGEVAFGACSVRTQGSNTQIRGR